MAKFSIFKPSTWLSALFPNEKKVTSPGPTRNQVTQSNIITNMRPQATPAKQPLPEKPLYIIAGNNMMEAARLASIKKREAQGTKKGGPAILVETKRKQPDAIARENGRSSVENSTNSIPVDKIRESLEPKP